MIQNRTRNLHKFLYATKKKRSERTKTNQIPLLQTLEHCMIYFTLVDSLTTDLLNSLRSQEGNSRYRYLKLTVYLS